MISPEGPELSAAVHFLINFPASRIYDHFSPIIFQTNRDFGDTRQGNFYLSGPIESDRLGLAVRGNAFRRDAAAVQSESVNGQQVSITSFGLSPTRSDIYNMGGSLSLTMGLRYNYHSTFGPSTNLTLKGGVSWGFRPPQLNQLANGIVGFGGQGTIPLIGSPGLEPETSTSTEAGAALTIKGVSFNTMLFNNRFQNEIANGPGAENCSFALSSNRPGCVDYGNWPNLDLFGQSIKVDEAVARGIEGSMRFRLFSKIDVQNNYTYTQSKQLSGAQTGQPLLNTPKHMDNSTTRYAATKRLNLWVRVEARSNRTRGTGASADAATRQIGPFQGYGMAHLGAGYQLTKQPAQHQLPDISPGDRERMRARL